MPPLHFPSERSHDVLVPASGTVPTQLACDIRPGAARQSYSLQWFRLNSGGSFSSVVGGINEDFSLTLHISSSSNNAVYMCTVTINHDGTGNAIPYDGARITIRTTGKYSVLSVHCACMSLHVPTTTTELRIQHNHNFGSGLVLTCAGGLFPLQSGVTFQRNNVTISEEVNYDGRMNYPLTQDKEGEFTCAQTVDGQTVKSDTITLAGTGSSE